MAVLSITASSVKPNADVANLTRTVLAGGTITGGEPVYKTSALKYFPGLNTTESEASIEGIALTSASVDQPFEIIVSGVVDFNAVLTIGESYMVGDAAGNIVPVADLGTSDYVTFLGVAQTTTALLLHIRPTGISHA